MDSKNTKIKTFRPQIKPCVVGINQKRLEETVFKRTGGLRMTSIPLIWNSDFII